MIMDAVLYDRDGLVGEYRDWSVVQAFFQQVSEPPATASIVQVTPRDLERVLLRVEGKALTEGDLVSICGARYDAADGDNTDRLYGICKFCQGRLQPSTVADAGPDDIAQDLGEWSFRARTGRLTSRDANYVIEPDCPFYLEAIVKDWTWEDHFDAVVDLIDPDFDFVFSDQPEAAAKMVAIFSAFIREREQQAKDAARIEGLLNVVRGAGLNARRLISESHINDLANLYHLKDPLAKGAASRILRDLQIVWEMSLKVDREHLEGKTADWSPEIKLR